MANFTLPQKIRLDEILRDTWYLDSLTEGRSAPSDGRRAVPFKEPHVMSYGFFVLRCPNYCSILLLGQDFFPFIFPLCPFPLLGFWQLMDHCGTGGMLGPGKQMPGETLVNKVYGNKTKTRPVTLFWMLLFSKRGNWGNRAQCSFPLISLFIQDCLWRNWWYRKKPYSHKKLQCMRMAQGGLSLWTWGIALASCNLLA